MTAQPDLERALETARRAVRAAGVAAMRRFRTDLVVERKADRTPVTVADREAEAEILAVLREDFPDHDVLTEESGAHGEGGETRWIVDPLDGTHGFSRGGTFWGPLVALEHHGEVVVGAMALPALGETYFAARGLGCFRDGTRLRVSGVDGWREATLMLGEIPSLLGGPHGPGVRALVREAASVRGYGDLAGWTPLLEGRAEACLEAGVRPWDIAAAKVLVEEAGGRFTDFDGGPSIESGRAVATNGLVHEHVLTMLRVSPR